VVPLPRRSDHVQVRCRNLTVSFDNQGQVIHALEDLSFESADGEFLAVIGPSGCGKTTLLRALAGLVRPTAGVIEHGARSGDRQARTLLVFQENGLFPWMTVLDNATFGLQMQNCPRPDRERRARELLDRFGLAGREHAYPYQLSVGMKQRVAVIRSFLSDPSLLLMDEPFAALDAQTRLTLQQELLALWEQDQRNVIFVTHDVDEAILLSDRVLVLSPQPGKVVAEYPVPFRRPRTGELLLEEESLFLKREIHRHLGMKSRGAADAG